MSSDRYLPPEVQLVLCCARTELDAATRTRVAALLSGDIDWFRVVHLALEHRVVPLLHQSLASLDPGAVPAELMESLQLYSATATRNNPRMMQALLEVLEGFARKGIHGIPFKGPVLALAAYGRLDLRHFFDVDLLVREPDVRGAREVLEGLGYAEILKQLTWETEFRRADAAIDLHWRISPAQLEHYFIGFDFDLAGAFARRQSVVLLGRDVPCLDPEDTILVQCQSSLKNGFNRSLAQLRWVCDIAELVRAQRDLQWDALLTRATAARSRRALLLCLDLARTLLGTPLPDVILHGIDKDPVVAYLRRRLTRHYVAVEAWQSKSLAAQFLCAGLVKEELVDALPYFRRCLDSVIKPNDKDRELIQLPRGLQGLYYLMRPVRLCFTHWRPASTRNHSSAG